MLKNKCLAYWTLMRCHRPIGFFLLLWPTLWGLWIAGDGHPPWNIVLIFIAGVFVMRPAGCIINDIADRKFDGKVTRTKDRPLAAGEVTLTEAFLLFIGLLIIALCLVLFLNIATILLAIVALFLSTLYPFCKRFTFLPQVILGAAWYISVLMAFTAVQNTIPPVAWLIYISVIVWTVAYDTMYAMADRHDDVKIGIKSTAILFGSYDKLIVGLLQSVTWLSWLVIGWLLECSIYFYFSLFFVAILFIYQQCLIRNREPAACVFAFLNNNWVGAAMFIGITASAF